MTDSSHHHRYAVNIVWEDDTGGTANYAGYSRDHRLRFAGKPDLAASADTIFHGDARRANPEDLFVGAIAACHMLTYLGLCARHGVRVIAYQDDAVGELRLERDGVGTFTRIALAPRVTIDAAADIELALRLHGTAHERCFLARSTRVPIEHQPHVIRADTTVGVRA
jgi:organic hydroperoxide reductase OsmC/OhrA